jgi:hypothetical protein
LLPGLNKIIIPELNISFFRNQVAHHVVKQGGFTASAGSNQCKYFTFVDIKRYTSENGLAPKAFGKMLDFKNRCPFHIKNLLKHSGI